MAELLFEAELLAEGRRWEAVKKFGRGVKKKVGKVARAAAVTGAVALGTGGEGTAQDIKPKSRDPWTPTTTKKTVQQEKKPAEFRGLGRTFKTHAERSAAGKAKLKTDLAKVDKAHDVKDAAQEAEFDKAHAKAKKQQSQIPEPLKKTGKEIDVTTMDPEKYLKTRKKSSTEELLDTTLKNVPVSLRKSKEKPTIKLPKKASGPKTPPAGEGKPPRGGGWKLQK